jgi:hypothetical protein
MSAALRWSALVTATSSVAHTGESLGTVSYLRRERFLTPTGPQMIPVISGNAWRGLLRDTAADLWWEAVGQPKLTVAVIHALWSGGALAKVSGPTLTGARLGELRRVCPVIGVFGAAGGGRIISGAAQVGKMVPLCAELAHVLPAEVNRGDLPSIWDLTQIEYYSRFPAGPHGQDDTDGLMRYGVETFTAGAQFATWASLTWPTEVETAFFAEVLDRFAAAARVGGMGRVGHGQLNLDLTGPATLAPAVDWRAAVTAELGPNPDRLLEILSWLD